MEVIKVKYSVDYDIIKLNSRIISILSEPSDENLSAKKELTKISKKLSTAGSVSKIKSLMSNKEYIEENISKTDPVFLLGKYKRETSEYLAEYSKLPKKTTVVDAMGFDRSKPSSVDIRREKLVDSYISIAKKYVKLDVVKSVNTFVVDICSSCKKDLSEVKSSLAGVKICPCGFETEPFRSTIVPPKDYFVWGNFLKTFNRNVGEVEIKIIDLILSDLDTQATMLKEPIGEYYRNLPLNEYGYKDGTSVDSLCVKLGELGYSKYFDNYAFIGHKQYGWRLKTHLKSRVDEIKHNFEAKQAVWDNMSYDEKEGDSSISNQYRLCRELQHIGERCRLRDFNVSRKKETIERYNRVYRKMCIGAGFAFPHYKDDSYSSDNE